ncbi:MAG: tetratricopeptide repeat protein [Proteobacteria bacterium]|nr:tetratricopeptide repeat protein [Pseudomonadota bacterium]
MTYLTEAEAESLLRRIAGQPDPDIALAEAALALAQIDRPRVPLERYRAHLARLVVEAREELLRRAGGRPPSVALAAEALTFVIHERYGYAGDELTYDDLQNANLIRLIDRRKGLPVALGILYIHIANGLGFVAEGLNFPGHFLVRVRDSESAVVLDPFNGGRRLDVPALRQLIKTVAGEKAELTPAHTAAVSNRDVLLRLQNNIKLRLLRLGRIEGALLVVKRMLMFAPEVPDLWREAGTLHARLDNLQAAIGALEQFVRRSPSDRSRYQASIMIQELRNRLN